ncbi:tetratricopeptide (TPR) repeat protein [Lysobacter sp. HA35]
MWLAAVALVLVATAGAYWRGLHGPFLFDDFANLPALGQFDVFHHPRLLVAYLTSGNADPTGRPVSLLTFLVDANGWPDHPLRFKRTNLIIHALTGLLLLTLLVRMGARLGLDESRARAAALFGTACWLLHPLFVSTVLYVVQREAMLSTLFVFAGLVAFDAAVRSSTSVRARRAGWLLYVGCLVLGTLSKANGALLPVLAWLIAYCLPDLRDRTKSPAFKGLVVLPAAVVCLSLAIMGFSSARAGVLPYRGWSVAQRLLTEPRVLIDYLTSLWIPQPYGRGVFHDDMLVSTSSLQPATTLPSLIAVVLAISVAWRWRRAAPALCAAVLFFFASHLIESTVIPLELYFEHRNYLAAGLMFWPLGVALSVPVQSATRVTRALRAVAPVTIPLLLACLTWVRAGLWGDATSQALLWARLQPESARAQAYAATYEVAQRRPEAAAIRLRPMLASHPGQPQLALGLVEAECARGRVAEATLDSARRALATARTVGAMEYGWLSTAVEAAPSTCTGLDAHALGDLVDALAANPVGRSIAGRRQDVAQLRGLLALRNGKSGEATAWFQRSLDQEPRPAVALNQAATLAQGGDPCVAEEYLAHASSLFDRRPPMRPHMRAIHDWWLWRTGYWTFEAAHLRRQLQSDGAYASCPTR